MAPQESQRGIVSERVSNEKPPGRPTAAGPRPARRRKVFMARTRDLLAFPRSARSGEGDLQRRFGQEQFRGDGQPREKMAAGATAREHRVDGLRTHRRLAPREVAEDRLSLCERAFSRSGFRATPISGTNRSATRPSIAHSAEAIQNRTTICVSGQPWNSKWWCSGAQRRILLPVKRYPATCSITLSASATNTPPTTRAGF